MRRVSVSVEPKVLVPSRWVHSSASASAHPKETVVEVHSKGYGPSSDILKSVPSSSRRLAVVTKLHPRDAEIQKRILSLTRPSLTEVSVTSDTRPTGAGTAGSATLEDPLSQRISSLESSFEHQLSSLGNLIVERIKADGALSLSSQVEAQNENTTALAQVVIHSLRNELSSAKLGNKGVDLEKVSQQVSDRISRELNKALSGSSKEATKSLKDLEKRIEERFTRLSEAFSAVGENSALPQNVVEDITNSLNQTIRIEQDSLRSTMEEILSKSDGQEKAVDMDSLEQFIEGALRASMEEVRHSISGEFKKMLKQIPAPSSDSSPDISNHFEDLRDKMHEAWEMAEDTHNTIVEQTEKLEALLKGQKNLENTLTELKTGIEAMEHSAGAATTTTASIEAASLDEMFNKLRDEFSRVRSLVELSAGHTDDNIASSISAISDCIGDVVEHRTSAAVQRALETVQRTAVQPPSKEAEEDPHKLQAAIEEVLSSHLKEFSASISSMESKLSVMTQDSLLVFTEQVERMITKTLQETQMGGKTELNTDDLRDQIVESIQSEMSKPHEVNLTAMYEYIDGVLTFIKEEYAKQEDVLQSKMNDISNTLASKIEGQTEEYKEALQSALGDVVKRASSELGEYAKVERYLSDYASVTSGVLERIEKKIESDGVVKLNEILGKISEFDVSLKTVDSVKEKLSDMEKTAATRNEELIAAISASQSTDEMLKEQLSILRQDLKDTEHTRNIAANAKLEELNELTASRLEPLREINFNERFSGLTKNMEKQQRLLRDVEERTRPAVTIMTREEHQLWTTLRSEAQSLSLKITGIVEKMERAPPSEYKVLLQQLSLGIAELDEVHRRETELSSAKKSREEAAAVTLEDVADMVRKVEGGVSKGTEATLSTMEKLLVDMKSSQDAYKLETAEIKNVLEKRTLSLKDHVTTSLQTTILSAKNSIEETIQNKKTTLPVWWVVFNALVITISILCCTYYLFACFLVAFVPTTPAPVEPSPVKHNTIVKHRKKQFVDELL